MTSSMISSVPAPMRFSRMSRHDALDRRTPSCSRRRRGSGCTRRRPRRRCATRSSLAIEISRTGYSPFCEAPGGRVDQLAGRLDLRRHLGELVADDLELADLRGRTPVRSIAYCERLLEAPLGAGDAARRADQPLALELPHDVVEALAVLAEQRGRRDADVLEREQRGVGRVHAELLAASSRGSTPGASIGDEEQREAVVAGVGVGLRDEHDHVGAVAVGDVRLRAVDDALVAVARPRAS